MIKAKCKTHITPKQAELCQDKLFWEEYKVTSHVCFLSWYVRLSEIIETHAHAARFLLNIKTNRDKWLWGRKRFVSCLQLGVKLHKHFRRYKLVTFMCDWLLFFCVLRDGIVARFVATDGGITRVYPRRYSPFCLLTPSSSVSSGLVK